jgi:ABC-type transporter Mla maintaining outer membrane lipid asymmetry permease subunit MlaE
MQMITKLNNMLYGFILCALLASISANIAMYQGYLIDKTKLQVTVCTAVQEAVSNYSDDMALPNAIDKKVK